MHTHTHTHTHTKLALSIYAYSFVMLQQHEGFVDKRKEDNGLDII